MDGYETAQIIRGREQTKRIPIVFLSAVNKENEHLMRGYSMGAVDYVFKPVEPVVLRSKVAVFVDLFTDDPGDPAQGGAGAAAARRQSARQCRAASGRAGVAPRRAAPGGDHRLAADHPLSRGGRRRPRVPQFVGGNFAAVTGFRVRRGRGPADACGPTGSTPTIASGSLEALRERAADRRDGDRISLALRRRPVQAFPRPGGASARADGDAARNMPAPCSTSATARISRTSCSRRARWTRSAS